MSSSRARRTLRPAAGLGALRWTGTLLVDGTVVVLGVYQYFLHPLASPYPFIWLFDLLTWAPSERAMGLMTFLAIGLTPTAALLLLFNSIAQAVLPQGPHPLIRLVTGAFCLVVGVGFLITLLVYLLRAPQVLDWEKEAMAAVVHLLIALRGLSLASEVYPRYGRSRLGLALASSLLWVAMVSIPQHPWLVVWLDSLQDWLEG